VTAPLTNIILTMFFPFHREEPVLEKYCHMELLMSLKKKITEDHIQVTAVSVWESDTASATKIRYED